VKGGCSMNRSRLVALVVAVVAALLTVADSLPGGK
jgi:hypothetical protein